MFQFVRPSFRLVACLSPKFLSIHDTWVYSYIENSNFLNWSGPMNGRQIWNWFYSDNLFGKEYQKKELKNYTVILIIFLPWLYVFNKYLQIGCWAILLSINETLINSLNLLRALMAQGLVRRAEDLAVPGSSPTQD